MTAQHNLRVDILMATYNGQQFLSEQIDSILTQTHSNIHLYIRDDGSQDDTRKIIQEKKALYPTKITHVPAEVRLGIIGNFSALMEQSKAEYVMFSDQDDIWLPNKIAYTLSKLHSLEITHGTKCPLLVHTDLQVVDEKLKVLDLSFWNYSKLNPKRSHTLNKLLMQNVITGCTMMMNRALVDLSKPIPKEVMMHDWWIGLVAAAMGKVDTVNEPTILYRQHGKNQLGAKKERLFPLINRFLSQPKEHIKLITTLLNRQCKQATLFLNRYESSLNKNQQEMVQSFSQLHNKPFLQKIYHVCKYRFFKNGFLRNTRMLLLLMFQKYK